MRELIDGETALHNANYAKYPDFSFWFFKSETTEIVRVKSHTLKAFL